MANKKMTRADKISRNLVDLTKVRSEISDYNEIISLLPEKSHLKAKNILARLVANEEYLVESTCRQGFMMIVEGKKVESFINALPAILK